MVRTVHFKTNTLLKNLVGKDLINDDNIAVVELVKNSYDANATRVIIKFENEESTGGGDLSRIVIADNGSGMSEKDIEDKWLNIAYSEKKLQSQPDGGFYAGNKGIGRFSCDRLGEQLDLLTRSERGEKLLHLQIRWPDFEREGEIDLLIQEIGVTLSRISDEKASALAGVKLPDTGTILVISKLRSSWNRDALISLKQSLEKFINPNQIFQKKSFSIRLDVASQRRDDEGKEYYLQVNGVVQNRVFQKLEFNSTYIHATVSRDGSEIDTALFHEGQRVFQISEKNVSYLHLKAIEVVVYYLNPYKKAYFKRQTGIRSIDFGSIFLFLNGFRVAPYGERGDDWLGLDNRKTQGTGRYLGNRELLGRIEVFDTEESFKPISSREGLKRTVAFVELKERFFFDVLQKLEGFVVDGLGWDSVPESLKRQIRSDAELDWKSTAEEYVESWDKKRQRIAFAILDLMGAKKDSVTRFWFDPALLDGLHERRKDDLKRLINTISEYSNDQVDGDLTSQLKKISGILEKNEAELRAVKTSNAALTIRVGEQQEALKLLEREAEKAKEENLFLRSLTTLDETNLLAFHHQILLDADILEANLAKALKAIDGDGTAKAAIPYLHKISHLNKKIIAVAQFATKANFKATAAKQLTDLIEFVESYVLNVAANYIGTGLRFTVRNDVREPFVIKTSRIELSILIDSIISNSVKAHARAVTIYLKKEGENDISIRFVDDGRGLDKSVENIDDIFQIGVTTTAGSGIGLAQVRKFIGDLGGVVTAIDHGKKGFEIRMDLTK
ncbi:ATP-binding protein [uncultured Herbaspirillum sp.]|uniref:ATP-binding protein n=1 Tax=uncultured Herbaspirillum sp. TaxID=160236 RepID=UPI002587A6CA|nr:ATP-binding protein [uncultured Herbaspirillum sp.]